MKNPIVFTDFHHASLLQSFIHLFEKRLGGKVYRPIGVEWFEKGFWKVYDHPATVQQFLGIGGATPDRTPRLNEVREDLHDYHKGEFYPPELSGMYACHDIDSGSYNKAITFDTFMKSHIDIVIASLPTHIEPFKKLCELHPHKPKLIYQIGNDWPVGNVSIPNIMSSAKIYIPSKYHSIIYHQEFDTNIFKWDPKFYKDDLSMVMPDKFIYSFVNCFSLPQDHFAFDWKLFQEIEKLMPDWSFRSFGGQCRDGAINGTHALSAKMSEARFIWHTKNGGDGYGHILHNAAAVGKPMIVKEEYYMGKLGAELLIDGKTCISIDRLSPEEIINKITHYSQPELYNQLCKNVYQNFKEKVDFDKEAEKLKDFIANLI